MPLSFPSSPTVGQQSTQNGRTYSWTGYAWELVAAAGGGGSLSATVTIPGLGDPYYDIVSLLLHGDGDLTDKSGTPKTVTALGSAATSTTQAKFGTASLASLAAGDFYTVPHSSAFDFGSGDFTVEMWLYPVAGNSGYRSLYGKRATTGPVAPVQAFIDPSGVLSVFAANAASAATVNWTVLITASSSPSVGQWSHLAMVRSGSTVTVYLNGASVGSSSALGGSALVQNDAAFCVGSTYSGGAGDAYFGGYIDEFRVSKGVARYTASFTPATAAFADASGLTVPVVGTGSVGSGLSWSSVPASATASGTAGQIAYDTFGNFYICTATNTWLRTSLAAWETDPSFASVGLLLNMEGSGSTFVDYSSSPKTITAYHGATQSTAAPKFGSKSLYLNGTTFGAGPYLSVPYSSAFDLSTGDWTVECWAYATALNASNNLFAINGDGSSNAQVTVVPQANGSAYFLTQGAGGDWLDTTLSAAGTFTTNTWQHVAAVRAGNVFRLYVNGTSVVSFTSSSALMNASGLSTIGARLPAGNSTVGSQTWQGYIDEFRVTKGLARYTGATITVPTAAFPTS
jgi:hypothetical protein